MVAYCGLILNSCGEPQILVFLSFVMSFFDWAITKNNIQAVDSQSSPLGSFYRLQE
jgi:hypothetical protein